MKRRNTGEPIELRGGRRAMRAGLRGLQLQVLRNPIASHAQKKSHYMKYSNSDMNPLQPAPTLGLRHSTR